MSLPKGLPEGKGSLLQVAPNWKCNGRCIFCGLTMRKEELCKVPDMPFSVYKDLVDQCPSVEMVQPQGINEPLCYPYIVECVEYAAKRGKFVFFYTNGSLMTETTAQRLLDAGLSEVRYSIDACSKRGYEYLRGLSWKNLVQNVENFQKLRDKGGYDCKTIVRVTKVKENAHSINAIMDFWNKRVDLVRVQHEDVVPSSEWIEREPWASRKIKLARTCTKPWKHITIKPNGDMVLCCKDWYADYVMANIHEVSVLEGFTSDKFNDVRRRMRMQTDYPMICLYCKTPSKR